MNVAVYLPSTAILAALSVFNGQAVWVFAQSEAFLANGTTWVFPSLEAGDVVIGPLGDVVDGGVIAKVELSLCSR